MLATPPPRHANDPKPHDFATAGSAVLGASPRARRLRQAEPAAACVVVVLVPDATDDLLDNRTRRRGQRTKRTALPCSRDASLTSARHGERCGDRVARRAMEERFLRAPRPCHRRRHAGQDHPRERRLTSSSAVVAAHARSVVPQVAWEPQLSAATPVRHLRHRTPVSEHARPRTSLFSRSPCRLARAGRPPRRRIQRHSICLPWIVHRGRTALAYEIVRTRLASRSRSQTRLRSAVQRESPGGSPSCRSVATRHPQSRRRAPVDRYQK